MNDEWPASQHEARAYTDSTEFAHSSDYQVWNYSKKKGTQT